ncbi:MAG: hypothetical protein J1D77_07780 [Muribaculaceae bacterium]|nr:hypothetical protein [Muribaculaceae bacterium]
MNIRTLNTFAILRIIFLLLLAAVAESYMMGENRYWNKGRGYSGFGYATSEGILIDNPTDTLKYEYYKLGEASESLKLHFRTRNLHGSPSKKYPYYTGKRLMAKIGNPHWGFFLTGSQDTVIITAKGTEKLTALETMAALELTIYELSKKLKDQITLSEGLNPYDGDNQWDISVDAGLMHIRGGDRNMPMIYETEFDGEVTGFGFLTGWGGKLLVSDIDLQLPNLRFSDFEGFDTDSYNAYLSESEDDMEGYWSLFDRDIEESLIKLGGDYRFACIKDGDNYVFLYLEGAGVNSSKWLPGQPKIILTPSPFSDIFEVEWIDAMKESMDSDIKAQRGEGDTLLIQFPYQNSKIRLRRVSPSTTATSATGASTSKASSEAASSETSATA